MSNKKIYNNNKNQKNNHTKNDIENKLEDVPTKVKKESKETASNIGDSDRE